MINGILADSNAEGHLAILLRTLLAGFWVEFWNDLKISTLTFEELGLSRDVDDATLWRACQRDHVVLVTINRNADGPESLERTIRDESQTDSLPVFTLASADRIRNDVSYAEDTAVRLLEYLLDIDQLRGAGRIYVP